LAPPRPAEEVLPGIGGLLIVFAILNSSLANANAGATAATRSLFAMGRVSLLPRWFAAVHPETRAPANAVHFQAISALIIAVVLGFLLADDPYSFGLNVYVFLGTMLGLIFAGIYIAVNLACIGYFWRERRDEFNIIKHLIVPLLGVIAMIPAALAVVGGVTIPLIDVTLPPYDNYLRFTAPIVGVWILLGILLWFALRVRTPRDARPDGRRVRRRGAIPDRSPRLAIARSCRPAGGYINQETTAWIRFVADCASFRPVPTTKG
jgi:amino acid transporter